MRERWRESQPSTEPPFARESPMEVAKIERILLRLPDGTGIKTFGAYFPLQEEDHLIGEEHEDPSRAAGNLEFE